MATTPPPPSRRARTPPTPLHGPQYDRYTPYSPRRSTRATALSNPYSSLNSDRSPVEPTGGDTTPPPTNRKHTRFARARPSQLSSPPSSPASPVKRHPLHKTPRKPAKLREPAVGELHSDSDHAPTALAPSALDPVTMLPTPSKTPNKRCGRNTSVQSTARILNFQPSNPNDVMPSPQKIKKYQSRRQTDLTGFELYEDDPHDPQNSRDQIQIFTDANARVPEMDDADDNPFVGARRRSPVQARGSKRKARNNNAELVEEETKMNEAVDRGEGMIYVFRGKKIFRQFKSPVNHDADHESAGAPLSSVDLDQTAHQRRLRRQAGPAAERTLTRSAIKPRLLFPPQDDTRAGHNAHLDEDDEEEAVTDIDLDMPDRSGLSASPPKRGARAIDSEPPPPPARGLDLAMTPAKPPPGSKQQFGVMTPPTTARATRRHPAALSPGAADAHPSPPPVLLSPTAARGAHSDPTKLAPNAFDPWQRVQPAGAATFSRKRDGDSDGDAGRASTSKRTRSGI